MHKHLAAALTAAALTVSVAPALTAGTSEAAAPARTSLSIRAVKAAVAPGRSDTIAGNLSVAGGAASDAGRTVTLEARAAGETGFTPVDQAVSGTNGGLQVVVTPATTTAYRWHYAGAPDTTPANSGVVTVKVRTPQHPATRLPTSLSIRLVHHARYHRADVVRGRLVSHAVPLRQRRVILLSRLAGSTQPWQYAAATRTDADGAAIFAVHPAQRTAYRLFFEGTRTFRPARSGRVVDNAPSTVTAYADPSTITRGAASTIHGIVALNGSPEAGATVKLLARRHHHWVWQQSGTTLADGSLQFSVSPRRTTRYVLRVAHTTGVPAGESNRVWVVVRPAS